MQYEKKLFVFLDILGFAKAIEETTSNQSKISEIYKVLETSLEEVKAWANKGYDMLGLVQPLNVTYQDWKYHMFSDTVTLSCPYNSSDDFFALCMWVINYQRKIVDLGYFIRGSMVYSNILEDREIMFGPAIIESYNLERHVADWARIVIAPEIFTLLTKEEKRRYFATFIRLESNDIMYLDYLKEFFLLLAANSNLKRLSIPTNSLELLQHHKSVIMNQMKAWKNDSRILSIYCSLSKYHNQVIDEVEETINNLLCQRQDMRSIILGTAKDAKYYMDTGYPRDTNITTKNIEYVNTLPILGIALHRIIGQGKAKAGVKSDPAKFANYLIGQSPKYLKQLSNELSDLKIDLKAH